MKQRTMEQRRNYRKFTMADKIFMYVFSILTILAVIGLIIGALALDTPNTAIPEIMCILSITWFIFVVTLGSN